MKLSFLSFILFSFIFISCNGKKIKITKDYIINEKWEEYHYRVNIEKLIATDEIDYNKVLSPNYDEPNYIYLTQRLKVDSSFDYGFNQYKADKIKSKVFFNQDNGWKWGCYCNGLNDEKNILGSLENSTWYKFSDLLMNTKFFIYVYVDETGKTYQFHVNNANF